MKEEKKKMLIKVDAKTHQFLKDRQEEYKKDGFRISLASLVEKILEKEAKEKS